MTYIDEAARAPVRRSYAPANLQAGEDPEFELLVRGQGTIGFAIARQAPFTVIASGSALGMPRLRWVVAEGEVILAISTPAGEWHELLRCPDREGFPVGVDPWPACSYWFSFDCHNRALLYGKGEMRLGTALARYDFPPPAEGESAPDQWLRGIERVSLSAAIAGNVDMWRDPVAVEPPMRVVPHDAIAMEDIAWGRVTVPASLTPTCQKLYDNVAGKRFVLDTPDFPEFSAAIKASIADPAGWCHQLLARKAGEFGEPDIKKTYLRITLGINQGESPGIPFVMEIWPSGHYSPIHNHGGADAVIRVLHGEITVNLFPMLSPDHLQPFAVKTFVKEDVTWISARLNQVHKLINLGDEPCITIQCYLYADDNEVHWPYFDYLEKGEVEHFDPNSDADFLTFKQLMKAEWARR